MIVNRKASNVGDNANRTPAFLFSIPDNEVEMVPPRAPSRASSRASGPPSSDYDNRFDDDDEDSAKDSGDDQAQDDSEDGDMVIPKRSKAPRVQKSNMVRKSSPLYKISSDPNSRNLRSAKKTLNARYVSPSQVINRNIY